MSIVLTNRVMRLEADRDSQAKKIEELYRLSTELRELAADGGLPSDLAETLRGLHDRMAEIEARMPAIDVLRGTVADLVAGLQAVNAELKRRRGGRPRKEQT